jgi:hypothetical protein
MDETMWLVLLLAFVGVSSWYSKHEVKEFNELSLSRMQFVESNLLKAQTKLDVLIQSGGHFCGDFSNTNTTLCDARNDINNALIDVRPQLIELHKKLEN